MTVQTVKQQSIEAARMTSNKTPAPDFAPDKDTEFQIDRWPFYWLAATSAQYHEVLERALKARGLDIPRWRVLMLLEAGAARSVSYLAREAISKLPTMARIVQRMEVDGLVETGPCIDDARVTRAKLTRRGQAARRTAWREAHRVFDKAFEGITDKEREQLNLTLAKLFENLQALAQQGKS